MPIYVCKNCGRSYIYTMNYLREYDNCRSLLKNGSIKVMPEGPKGKCICDGELTIVG